MGRLQFRIGVVGYISLHIELIWRRPPPRFHTRAVEEPGHARGRRGGLGHSSTCTCTRAIG